MQVTVETRVLRGDSKLPIVLQRDDLVAITAAIRRRYLEPRDEHCPVATIALFGEDFDGWGNESLLALFRTIGQMETLVRLEFHHFLTGAFPLALGVGLLESVGNRLEYLEFASVKFIGTKDESRLFCDTIGGFRCLQGCTLTGTFTLMETGSIRHHGLDPLLVALTSLPTLLELDIQTQWWEEEEEGSDPCREPMEILSRSQTIRDLTLGDFHPYHHRLGQVKQILQNNLGLRTLELAFAVSEVPVTADCLSSFFSALSENKTLVGLKLSFYGESEHESVLVALTNAIEICPDSSLKTLGVLATIPSDRVRRPPIHDALVKLMQNNYSLEDLKLNLQYPDQLEDFLQSECGRMTEIGFFLHLNRLGRKDLMRNGQNVSRERWIGEFAKLSNDLDGLFYYLGQNPWLCQCEP